MLQTLSLRTRFVLFSLVCLIPLCAVVGFFFNLSRERGTELQIEHETTVASSVDWMVSSYFDRTATFLERIAGDPEVSALDPTAAILGQAPRLDYNLFLVDAEASIVSPTTNPPTDLVSGLTEQIESSVTNRQIAISPRFALADNTSIVVMTVPVVAVTEVDTSTPVAADATPSAAQDDTTPPGEVVGVLGAILRLDSLEQQVLSMQTDDMDIAVVRPNDEVILGTAGVLGNQDHYVAQYREAIDQARSGRISDFTAVDPDGTDILGVYRPTLVTGNSWSTIVTTSSSGSFIESMWFQGLIVLLLVGLVILVLAVVLGELTARPLRTLTRKAEAMGEGDFTSRIEPIGSGEILRLSTALTGMSMLLEERLYGEEDVREVRESQTRQMRDLLRRTLRLQEDEQRRIASEIHDAVSPLITGALYQARALQMGNGSTPDEQRIAALNSVNQLLERATTELHGVIFDLRPPDLDDLGIVAAIEAYVTSIQRTNLNVRLDLGDEPPGLNSEVRLGMYRIVQEALHNVMRHSGADEALVRLESSDGLLKLTIRDNGSGFDPETSVRPTSLGLLSMRERAAAIGATLAIVSRPGGGTALILERKHTDSVMSDDVLADLISHEAPQRDNDDVPVSAAAADPVHNDALPPLPMTERESHS